MWPISPTLADQRARYLPSGGYNYQNSEVYARVKRLLLVRPKLSVIRSVMTRRVVTTSPCKLKQPLNGYRSEEHTSELQSRFDLVCRLLLEKKKKRRKPI